MPKSNLKHGIKKGIRLEEDTSIEKSWFFGIGINQYQHFGGLQNAKKDVQDLLTLLQDQYDIDEACTVLLFDEAATRKNIITQLDQLVKQVQPNDKLIIYYSGHGFLDETLGKGYWIPTDAEKDNTAAYIRNATIREYVQDIKSFHTLLISDSCFSGSLFVRGVRRSGEAIEDLEGLPSRWAICSGRHNQEVYDGEPGKNSPFAESIMDNLKYNKKPKLNVAKLADRVVEQTRANSNQLPEANPIQNTGHKGGQYIFHRKVVGATEQIQDQTLESQGIPQPVKPFIASPQVEEPTYYENLIDEDVFFESSIPERDDKKIMLPPAKKENQVGWWGVTVLVPVLLPVVFPIGQFITLLSPVIASAIFPMQEKRLKLNLKILLAIACGAGVFLFFANISSLGQATTLLSWITIIMVWAIVCISIFYLTLWVNKKRLTH